MKLPFTSSSSSWRKKKLEEDATDYKNIATLPYQNTWVPCKVVHVHDGDTVTIVYVDQKELRKTNIRVVDIDTAEIRGGSESESKAACVVRDHVSSLVLGKVVEALMIKHDKYGGRVIGDIRWRRTTATATATTKDEEETATIQLSHYLLENKLAHQYDGKRKKQPFTQQELQHILEFANK